MSDETLTEHDTLILDFLSRNSRIYGTDCRGVAAHLDEPFQKTYHRLRRLIKLKMVQKIWCEQKFWAYRLLPSGEQSL